MIKNEMVTGGISVAQQLVLDGVDTIFGVPGIQLDYFVDGLAQRRDEIRFISCRHEQGAAYMADGYARVTHRPGVFTVVPGPGVLNAGAALSTAYACSSPVVCLAAQIRTDSIGRNLGLLHEIRGQEEVLASVAKNVYRVRDVAGLAPSVHHALAESMSGRPRPVVVSMPDDLLKAELPSGFTIDSPLSVTAPVPDETQLAHAAALIRDAEHPVILAGGGVATERASRALSALATKLHAPVVVTQNGKGAVSDRHDWAHTSLGGRAILPQADLVVLVGTRGLRLDGSTIIPPQVPQIIVNADPAGFGPPRNPVVSLLGDSGETLEALLALSSRGKSLWNQAQMDDIRAECQRQIATYGELHEWVMGLRQGIPEDGILVGELTQVSYFSRVSYPVYHPRTSITAGYQGTLGFGTGTAIGAQIGRPDTPVVSISGDGGFAYGIPDLLTAVKYEVPVTLVVFNDQAYGNVRRIQAEQFDGRTIGTTLHNPTYTDLGRAMGMEVEVVGAPDALAGALTNARSHRGPTLIEVPVGQFRDPSILTA